MDWSKRKREAMSDLEFKVGQVWLNTARNLKRTIVGVEDARISYTAEEVSSECEPICRSISRIEGYGWTLLTHPATNTVSCTAPATNGLHEFAVGDRFACYYKDLIVIEVAEIGPNGTVMMSSREHDNMAFTTTQDILHNRCAMRYDLAHISGPTFKAPTKSNAKPLVCNCSGMITGVCRDWCAAHGK